MTWTWKTRREASGAGSIARPRARVNGVDVTVYRDKAYTPSERVSTEIIVERGGECGPAAQKLAPPIYVPVAFPTTGNSSTVILKIDIPNLT